jgi:hypothetical protein
MLPRAIMPVHQAFYSTTIPAARAAVVSVFHGVAYSGVLDQTHTGTGWSTSPTSGATSTTMQADELLTGAVGMEGPNVDNPGTWSSSFTDGLPLGTSFGSSSGDDTGVTDQLGWRIVGGTGAYTAQTVSLTTSRDWAAAIATFKAEITHDLTVTFVGSGTVNNTPGNPYTYGQTATLEPVADLGWTFAGWSGPDAGELSDNGDGTWDLTMDGDKAVTATFIQHVYYLPLILLK